jgi:hypothetical protein
MRKAVQKVRCYAENNKQNRDNRLHNCMQVVRTLLSCARQQAAGFTLLDSADGALSLLATVFQGLLLYFNWPATAQRPCCCECWCRLAAHHTLCSALRVTTPPAPILQQHFYE